MRYSIIDTKLGEAKGINPAYHRLCDKGSRMVVNENELKSVDEDIAKAAAMLGGQVLSQGQIFNELNKL